MIESQISSFNLIYRILIRVDKYQSYDQTKADIYKYSTKNHRSNAYCYKQFHISHNIFQEDFFSLLRRYIIKTHYFST